MRESEGESRSNPLLSCHFCWLAEVEGRHFPLIVKLLAATEHLFFLYILISLYNNISESPGGAFEKSLHYKA